MIYQTEKLKQDISNKMLAFRRKLVQHRRHLLVTESTSGVSPEPYLDLVSYPFNKREWTYLSLGKVFFSSDFHYLLLFIMLGPSFIRQNQSAIRPRKQQEVQIESEHKDIYKKVENHLVSYPHCKPKKAPIFKQYSNYLLHHLNHCYFTPLPYKGSNSSVRTSTYCCINSTKNQKT